MFFNKDKFERFSILIITDVFENYDEPTYRTRYYAIMQYQEREIRYAYKHKERVSLKLEDDTLYGLDFVNTTNYSIIPVYNMDDVDQLVNQPGISKNKRFTIHGLSNKLVQQLKKEDDD